MLFSCIARDDYLLFLPCANRRQSATTAPTTGIQLDIRGSGQLSLEAKGEKGRQSERDEEKVLSRKERRAGRRRNRDEEGKGTVRRGNIRRGSVKRGDHEKYVNRCTERPEDAGACEPSLRALRSGWVCPSFRILLRGHRVLSSATRREPNNAGSRARARFSCPACRHVEHLKRET